MTCKEVEQMIMPYINDELTDKQLGRFWSISTHARAAMRSWRSITPFTRACPS